MGTIQKRADELKPGDVFTWGGVRVVALRVEARDNEIVICTARLPDPAYAGGAPSQVSYPRTCVMQVETNAPDLTPAQQHADELAEALLEVRTEVPVLGMLRRQRIDALLDKIKPPEPPTLEEALYALQLVTEQSNIPGLSGQEQVAADVLDRARRAGLLK